MFASCNSNYSTLVILENVWLGELQEREAARAARKRNTSALSAGLLAAPHTPAGGGGSSAAGAGAGAAAGGVAAVSSMQQQLDKEAKDLALAKEDKAVAPTVSAAIPSMYVYFSVGRIALEVNMKEVIT